MWYRRLAGPASIAIVAAAVVSAATGSAPAGSADGVRANLAQPVTAATVRVGYNRQQLAGEDEANALFEEGQYEMDSGEPEMARRIFQQLLEQFPRSGYAERARRYLERLHNRDDDDATLQPITKSLNIDDTPDAGAPTLARPKPVQTAPTKLRPDRRLQFKMLHAVGDRVFFPPNSAALGAKARRALRNQAHWLNRHTEVMIEIVGHADDAGSEPRNLDLSQSRADAVRARLIDEGIAPGRLRSVAKGRTDPIAACAMPVCSAQNRRVVTRVLKIERTPHQKRGTSVAGTRR